MADREIWHVNGVDLAVRAIGRGPLVVLAHGFPDLGITWRLQVETLVEAGYRVVVPDMRGYGASARPPGLSEYAAEVIGLDLIGMLDHEGVERAHVVGHDWGASCVWRLGLEHPDRLLSLTGLSVPYVSAAPLPPMQILRSRHGEEFYQVRFQDESVAADLERDVQHTLSAAFSDRFDSIGRNDSVNPPTWLPRAIFDRYVTTFREAGFGGGLAYYRNIDDNWRHDRRLRTKVINCPSLFITGSADPVTQFMRVDPSSKAFSSLQVVVVDGAGHWVHQEAPVLVNQTLVSHFERASERQPEGDVRAPAGPRPRDG